MNHYIQEIQTAQSEVRMAKQQLKLGEGPKNLLLTAGENLRDAAVPGVPAQQVRYLLGLVEVKIRMVLKETRSDRATFHMVNALVGVGRARYALDLIGEQGTTVVIEGVTV